MRKMTRKPIILAEIDAKLEKFSRRIQAISEESYKLRQMRDQLAAVPAQTPFVKPTETAVSTEPDRMPIHPDTLAALEAANNEAKETPDAV